MPCNDRADKSYFQNESPESCAMLHLCVQQPLLSTESVDLSTKAEHVEYKELCCSAELELLLLYTFNPALKQSIISKVFISRDTSFHDCSNALLLYVYQVIGFQGQPMGRFLNLLYTMRLFEASKFWKLVGKFCSYGQNSQEAFELEVRYGLGKKQRHLRSYHPIAKTLVPAGLLSLSLQVKNFVGHRSKQIGLFRTGQQDISQVDLTHTLFIESSGGIFMEMIYRHP